VGGKGVETYYPYTLINGVSEEKFKDLSNAFREAAKKNGLLESGGSDFHGKTRKNVFLNQMNIPYFILENLKKNLPQA